jgi:hypothetical protein
MRTAAAIIIALLALGCHDKVESEPHPVFPHGDVDQGRQAFVELGCNSCHRVFDDELPGPNASPGVPITLGGAHARSRSHAELMTAIVNPSHEIAPGFKEELVRSGSKSRMGTYAHIMTIQQLVDILEYLEALHGWSTYGDEPEPSEER